MVRVGNGGGSTMMKMLGRTAGREIVRSRSAAALAGRAAVRRERKGRSLRDAARRCMVGRWLKGIVELDGAMQVSRSR
jgi:hypothetical protein